MKHARLLSLLVLAPALACGGGDAGDGSAASDEDSPARVPHAHRVIDTPDPAPLAPPTEAANAGRESGTTSLLLDHKGRVVPTIHFYVLYWGTGFEKTTEALYTTFLTGLGASGYWTIDTQVLRGAANHASYVSSFADTKKLPSATVTDADLQAELSRVLAARSLPYDANGLYFVVTPPKVKVCAGSSCSCQNFCGYHSAYVESHGIVLYSSIPSAAACPQSCGIFASDAASPNGNVEADEGVSVIAHEAEETQSDAYGSAWFDASGLENGDKCAYRYGPTTRATSGAPVNQTWGGKSWLVQMNWSNAISGCALKGPKDGPYSH